MKWKKNRQKGKFKYVITEGITFSIAWLVGTTIGILVKKGEFFHSLTEYGSSRYIDVFLGSFIGGGIGSLAKWSRNEEKYNNLTRK